MFKKDEHAKVRNLDVNEVIEEVLTLLRSELNSRRVSVRTELSQELPRISADRVQLQQVVAQSCHECRRSHGRNASWCSDAHNKV